MCVHIQNALLHLPKLTGDRRPVPVASQTFGNKGLYNVRMLDHLSPGAAKLQGVIPGNGQLVTIQGSSHAPVHRL